MPAGPAAVVSCHVERPLDERGAVFLVQVRDHRRVAAAADLVAAGGELGTERREVVQLAVEHGDHVAALGCDRLVAELRVQHLKALMAENAGAVGVRRALVRAAVADSRSHFVDEGRLGRVRRRIESADPAHAPQCA
jgi:hypothetical protein